MGHDLPEQRVSEGRPLEQQEEIVSDCIISKGSPAIHLPFPWGGQVGWASFLRQVVERPHSIMAGLLPG